MSVWSIIYDILMLIAAYASLAILIRQEWRQTKNGKGCKRDKKRKRLPSPSKGRNRFHRK
jgi:hypothetical protein